MQELTTHVPDEVSALNAGAQAALEQSNRGWELMATRDQLTECRLAALEQGQKEQIAAGLTTNLLLQQLISLQPINLSSNKNNG